MMRIGFHVRFALFPPFTGISPIRRYKFTDLTLGGQFGQTYCLLHPLYIKGLNYFLPTWADIFLKSFIYIYLFTFIYILLFSISAHKKKVKINTRAPRDHGLYLSAHLICPKHNQALFKKLVRESRLICKPR